VTLRSIARPKRRLRAPALGPDESTHELASSLRDLIDDNATIDDHRDPARAPTLSRRFRRVMSERKEGDVDARGLAASGR
jgi:hypothetical protein